MTNLLKKAFDEASRLPAEEQDALARLLIEELRSEKNWDHKFGGSGDRLAELADEALDEHQRGVTEELDPEEL